MPIYIVKRNFVYLLVMSVGRLYPPPIVSKAGQSISTISTPNNEEELEAARDVLRAVITKSSQKQVPIKISTCCASTQTDGVPLEGLIRAAGKSLVHFAAEIKSLERKVETQHSELLAEIKKLRN